MYHVVDVFTVLYAIEVATIAAADGPDPPLSAVELASIEFLLDPDHLVPDVFLVPPYSGTGSLPLPSSPGDQADSDSGVGPAPSDASPPDSLELVPRRPWPPPRRETGAPTTARSWTARAEEAGGRDR